jgi:hypothetical protein
MLDLNACSASPQLPGPAAGRAVDAAPGGRGAAVGEAPAVPADGFGGSARAGRGGNGPSRNIRASASVQPRYMVEPNQAAVLSLFGKYVGTVKDNGLRWNNPFFAKRKVSLRVRNFESGKLKVNELEGSPIEIAAVIVWKVVDSAEAVFNVDDYESFVHIQSESALRAMATSYPYDQHEEGTSRCAATPAEMSEHLKESSTSAAGTPPASTCSRRASATSPTRPRSPRPCCSASRRTR